MKKLVALVAATVVSLGGLAVAADSATAAPTHEQMVAMAKNMPTLRQGDTGDAVKALQGNLNKRGHNAGAEDGIFGAQTKQAVIAFQKANGLAADGVVGPATWTKITGHQHVGLGGSSGGAAGGSGSTSGNKADPRTSGASNGYVPDDMLCKVEWSDQSHHRVACYIIDDLNRMNEAYKAHFGENLDIEQARNSAYRTYDEQVQLANETPDLAATPGHSQHGWGLAVDLVGTDYGTAKYDWLAANGPSYGFSNTVDGEAWHWEHS